MKTGEKLGPYEITAFIGAGGMGEVYRALDPRLGREVAIKVSAERFSERFDREARAVAALNHPNICTLYDVGPNYLVMEFVEGAPPKGPMPVDEALRISRQIADALEAAHDKGIVHRDLKPGNILIRADGTVKVLDFGLAKMGGTASAASENSPTLSMAATQAGVILGTAAYMSPEQARGKPVDKRTDIWAFGAVLYEMVTGRQLFEGEDLSHTLASVIMKEPDLEAAPPRLRRVLKRCLEKDPKKRLRDITGVELLLEEEKTVAPPPSRARLTSAGWWVAAVLFFALAAITALYFRQERPQERAVRFQVTPPDKASIASFKLSPDGRFLAFVADEAGRTRLWIRALDSLESRVLPGTDGANNPFWSPDSAFIGFVAQNKLQKVAVAGGPPQTLGDASNNSRGTWSADGNVVFSLGSPSPLLRVPSSGGVPVAVTKQRPGEFHYSPQFLPGSRRFLYFIRGGKPETNGVYVGSLSSEPPIRLLPDESSAAYVPPLASGGAGHLLFRRQRALMAQPFDPTALKTPGEMFPLADQIATMATGSEAAFSASLNGVLAYMTGVAAQTQELVWMDRTGKQLGSAGPQGEYTDFRLSPDEKTLAFDRIESSNQDIWVLDMLRGVPSRLTSDPAPDRLPTWSPDGRRVLFPSRRGGVFDLYSKAATGAGQEEILVKMYGGFGGSTDWSRDGRLILYQRTGEKTGSDLWIAPQSGSQKPYPYMATQFNESDGMFSPDARWIAYQSDESGRDEVYVQSFPLSSEKKRISTNGGTDVSWRKNGTELFYLAADRNLMVVSVQVRGTVIEPGTPKSLFPVPGNQTKRSYAVSNDGKRFLVSRPVGETSGSPITVVLNWQAGLKQ